MILTRFALFAACLVVQTAACNALTRAGRRYLAGEIEGARRDGRRAGFVAAAACLAALGIAAWTAPMAGTVFLQSMVGVKPALLVALPLAPLATAASGAAALLGGLSGKPAPSGSIALALAAAGLIAAVAASGAVAVGWSASHA